MLYNTSAGAVELPICYITASAHLHSENEMFNGIIQLVIWKDTPTYRVTTFSNPVQA